MAAPEVHHLFHQPIADHSFSADKKTLAIAKESTVELYSKVGNAFKLKDELKAHDKTVTSVDIALRSGRIVSCSQGTPFLTPAAIPIPDRTGTDWILEQTEMPSSGSPPRQDTSRHSSCCA
jgi:hypothetical protein